MKNARIFGVALAAVVAISNKSAFAETVSSRKIADAWRQYFRDIHTLQYTETHVFDTHVDPTAVGMTSRMQVSLDGTKFRTDLSITPKREIKTFIHVYDGQTYQDLMGYDNGFSDLIRRKELKTDLPYGNATTVLSSFSFAFGTKNVWSLETAQSAALWNTVAQRITKVEAVKGNPTERKVTLTGDDPGDLYEVTVKGDTFFPVAFKYARHMASRAGGKIPIRGACQVTKLGTWRANGRNYFFPLATEGKSYWKGALKVSGHTSIDTTSWKVNLPVAAETFTLSKKQVDDAAKARTAFIASPNHEKIR